MNNLKELNNEELTKLGKLFIKYFNLHEKDGKNCTDWGIKNPIALGKGVCELVRKFEAGDID